MICSKCSNSLPESAKFCPQCGNRVISPDSTKQSLISEYLVKPRNAYGLILLTCAVAVVIIFLILDSNRKDESENEQTPTVPVEVSAEINALRLKISEDPNDLSSNIRMGNLLFDAGDYTGALPYYAHANYLDSLNISVQIDMAVCYFNIQNYTDAIENIKKALTLEPTHKKGLFNIGIMYSQIGDKDKARFYWENLISFHPMSDEGLRAKQLLENLK